MGVHEFNFFYVSRNGVQEGPLALSAIQDKIKSGYLIAQDYIYESKSNQWIPLVVFDKTKQFFETVEEDNMAGTSISEVKWYVLRSSQQLGPYTFSDVLDLISKKEVNDFDFVWNPKMSGWIKISDCTDFQNTSSTGQTSQVRRKLPRVDFSTSIIIHNNKKVWKAQSFSIGVGGVRIEVENSNFIKGEEIYLHFKADNELPAFNAICEVVNVQNTMAHGTGLQIQTLGAKFLKVNFMVQKSINEFVNKNSNNNISQNKRSAA